MSSSSSSSSRKRPAEQTSGSSSRKKTNSEEPLRIGPVANLGEMDIDVLRLQHSKLKQRLEQKQKTEVELIQRAEQLETRQTQDDAVLNVINRYWMQVDEDVGILLQRFGTAENPLDGLESKNDGESGTSFLTQLSTWDKSELDEKLVQRVQVTKNSVAKIIQAFDRLQQRMANVTRSLKGELTNGASEEDGAEELHVCINDIIKEESLRVEEENRCLVNFNTQLDEKLRALVAKNTAMHVSLEDNETKGSELINQVEDLQWEVNKLLSYNDKLVNHIQDIIEKYRRLQQMYASEGPGNKKEKKVEISDSEVSNLKKEIEELREQASNRLNELEKLHKSQRETLKELEKLRIDIRQLPESVIVETAEYKCLQSKFSVIYNDTLQLRATLDETRNQLFTMRTNHLKHIEHMESEELLGQKKVRTEMIQLEDMIGVVRKEYEILRLEFEQNLAAHEQTGPINREMRHLINSLQNHNNQLKGDSHRYKKKYKDLCAENAKLKKQKEDLESKIRAQERSIVSSFETEDDDKEEEEEDETSVSNISVKDENGKPAAATVKVEPDDSTATDDKEKTGKGNSASPKKLVKKESKGSTSKPSGAKVAESDTLKELRAQVQKALSDQKEMKLLLDMYKGAGKDPRDKGQIADSEDKVRQDLENVKSSISKMKENKKDETRKLADEEALRKIKVLEENLHSLQRQITNQKTEEDALVSEMEVTGQAFEDMQEQNARLLQQLREKDDANFKLLSDRVKACQFQKLAMEERELLQEHHGTLSKQAEAQNHVVRKLEEKERLLLNTIGQMEKEAIIRQQALELHKRKAIESAQSAADLKLHLEKYHSQMKDAQQTVAEKTSALEAEAYKTKRLQEDIVLVKRKVERLEKIEMTGNTDEVMMEEIREYKETLTCPSCKVKRKDAVLIKCFHVFCFDCLRTRYETRQRKCPKCNAAFGANDYHRLYLT